MIKYTDADKNKINFICVNASDSYYSEIEEFFEEFEECLEKNETIEQVMKEIPSYVYGTDKVIPRIDANFIADTLVENGELGVDYDDINMIKKIQKILDNWCLEVEELYEIDL